jgi:hypothetical protein
MAGLTLTGKPLLICEGAEELAFVNALVSLRNLQQFDLDVIGAQGGPPGINGLREHLPLLTGIPNFASVQNIALLLDTDESYSEAMDTVRDEIARANADTRCQRQFPIPRSAYRKWHKRGLTLTVILQPGLRAAGCLETSVWQIMQRLYPAQTQCVSAAVACAGIDSGANRWGISKLDKARVRAGIALIHRRSPAVPLTQIWAKQRHRNLVPIASHEFDVTFNHLAGV